MSDIIFGLVLCITAYQDLKMQRVRKDILTVGGVCGLLVRRSYLLEALSGAVWGALLLALSRLTKGAVGEGDGWFFVVSGICLGFQRNAILLLGSLGTCFLFSCGYLLWGQWKDIPVKKHRLPFLPFAVPTGMVLLICSGLGQG